MSLKVKEQEVGKFGVIQLTESGICQIGLTEAEYRAFEMILASFSKERPLTRLPKEYDLFLKDNN